MKAEEIYLHIGKLLQRYDGLTPLQGFQDLQNPSGHYTDLQKEIINHIEQLFVQSDIEGFFWYDCPLSVYSRTLPERLKYLNKNGNPSLTIEDLLFYDYKVFDIIPLYGQRILRTDKKELNLYPSLDYGHIIDKEVGIDLKEKLDLDRKKKMEFIQQHFQEQGKMIVKTGTEFNFIQLPSIIKEVGLPEPYTHIFSNNGYKLWEYILTNSITQNRGRKSDIAYFYWRMYHDKHKYIHARPEPFKEWFNTLYNEYIGEKLKTLPQVQNTQRDKEYSSALNWFKEQ